ncbi:hypothetical protein GGR58DRAFT_500860 [Xylaria digitata]|nr:hypothetical protein GGR58DRAFT_500860 [Xylaria digitata]
MTITAVVKRRLPLCYMGYATVMITVALQLAIYAVVLFLSWKQTRFSLMDNAWRVVSQVVSAETMSLLLQSTMLKDGDIQSSAFGGGDGGDKSEGEMRLVLREHSDGRVILQSQSFEIHLMRVQSGCDKYI